jgi:hypothetical protein
MNSFQWAVLFQLSVALILLGIITGTLLAISSNLRRR